ncbi:glycosyltransferase family 2 protein [Thermodesulforhabdus norvegica]|uniref:glycosyltransferase family 2 protein n=1 Tax=Thermodesulforhabdus norvegica TaxID=39841 RepID=UPI0015A66FDA|nr:glycosyltransferase [Thermodesulforhabdus norvegica]
MLVTIIIPVYGNLNLTKKCVSSILKIKSKIPFELIIIDDASQDATPDYLRYISRQYPFVRTLRNEKNSGFAVACNRGAAISRGKYLLFLNNDTVPLPGWLDALVEVAERDERIAVVGAKLLYPNGTIQHAGVLFRNFPFPLNPFHVYAGKPSDFPEANVERDYDVVTAACMLVRRDVFEKMGGFDERFVNGYEDVDFCLRVREAGYRVVYTPKSVVYHLESATPGRFDHSIPNIRLLHNRWMGKVNYVLKKEPRVTVVIVNYNGWGDTLEALSSVFMKERYERFNVVVVDNASKIDLSNEIKAFCDDVGRSYYRVTENVPSHAEFKGEVFFKRLGVNKGFGGGCNEGIKMALAWGADYVWLLNNDTIIGDLAMYYLVSLAEYFQNVAIVGSQLRCYPDVEKVQFDGSSVSYRGISEAKDVEKILNVSFVSGASMLIKSDFLRSYGLLREDYFLYFEDNEICLRARRCGFEILYNPLSVVYHKGGSSIGDFMESPISNYYGIRNSLFFYEEFYKNHVWDCVDYIQRSVLPKLVSKGDVLGLEAALEAIKDFLQNRKGPRESVTDGEEGFRESLSGNQPHYANLLNSLLRLQAALLRDPGRQGIIRAYFDTVRTLISLRIEGRRSDRVGE